MLLRPALAVLVLGLGPVVSGCTASADDGLTVVTSFYPLEYVAERIVGPDGSVTNLTSPGREPHDLELSVAQTAELSDAAVVVYERGLQPAVDDAVDTAAPDHVVDAADEADLRDDDPHFWHDPERLAAVARAVADELGQADPDHAADYQSRLATLMADLDKLDGEFRDGLESCRTTTVVVTHEAFGYLAKYGLQVESITGLSPDAEPSPAHLADLQDLIRTDGITTVFVENLVDPGPAETLAHDLGIGTATLDSLEGLTDATSDEDYLSLMRGNLDALRSAGGCR
jgi:zinc transport system substrate-binding protein